MAASLLGLLTKITSYLVSITEMTAERLGKGDDWKVLERRSVILSGPTEGRTYFRGDFLDGLQAVLTGAVNSHVLSFGPLARNNEWYLCLSTDAAKDQLLSVGIIKAKGYTFRVRSADRSQFKVRVHWAPPFLPNETITNYLSQYGKVHSIGYEKSVCKGFEGVATGVRTLIMSGNRKELPHIMTMWDGEGQKSELLVTVTGRRPLCLRCRQEGHFRRECFTPYCRHHGEYGHSTESCAAAGSYASALKEKETAIEAEVYNVEEEREGGRVREKQTQVDKEIGVKVAAEVEKERVQEEKADSDIERGVTTVPETQERVEVSNKDSEGSASEDMFSGRGSVSMSSDDEEDKNWVEVKRKKRKRERKQIVISSPHSPSPHLLGRLVIVEKDSESEPEGSDPESRISAKKKCAEKGGEEENGTVE